MGKIPWKRDRLPTPVASLVAQTVKNLPTKQETWVRSLGLEDPLQEDMATHSKILAWRIPMDRGAWQATVHGVAESWTQLKRLSVTPQVDSASLRREADTQLGLCSSVGPDLDSACRETGEGASDLSISAH